MVVGLFLVWKESLVIGKEREFLVCILAGESFRLKERGKVVDMIETTFQASIKAC